MVGGMVHNSTNQNHYQHQQPICSSKFFFYINNASISQHALWLEFLGPNLPRPVVRPQIVECVLLLKSMYDVGCEANRRYRKDEFLLMLIFFSCWIRHTSNVDYCINRWSWTDFIVDVEKDVELQIMVVDVGSDFDSLHEFCTIPPTIVRAFLFYIDSRKEEPVPNFRLNRFS